MSGPGLSSNRRAALAVALSGTVPGIAKGSGFCLLNNVAVAASYALERPLWGAYWLRQSRVELLFEVRGSAPCPDLRLGRRDSQLLSGWLGAVLLIWVACSHSVEGRFSRGSMGWSKVHHGQGTQQIFEQNPNVLFISFHRYDGRGS